MGGRSILSLTLNGTMAIHIALWDWVRRVVKDQSSPLWHLLKGLLSLEERPCLQPQKAYSPRTLPFEGECSGTMGLSSRFHQLAAPFHLFFCPLLNSNPSHFAPRLKILKMSRWFPLCPPSALGLASHHLHHGPHTHGGHNALKETVPFLEILFKGQSD